MVFKNRTQIPEDFRINKRVIADKYICNGKLKTWKGEIFEVISPIKIKDNQKIKSLILGSYPLMDSNTALVALEEAYRAYDLGNGMWPTMSVGERVQYFETFTNRLREYEDEIVNLMMWEISKNHRDSKKEFKRTIEYIEDSIKKLKEMITFSNDFILEGECIGQIKRSPLGVVLCMGPYNYPLNESFTTMIPAMMMGNTVIFKPPKKGVLLHTKIVEIFCEVFPKGVFNIIYGEGEKVIKPIMETGKISVLAFIGSSKVANIIQRYHPKPNRLRLVLGLEAKNVGIVLKDADLKNTISECVKGTLSFNGQRCTALKLLYVHEYIAEKFIKKFCDKVDDLSIGMPWENSEITPIIEENINFYEELVRDALEKGAKIVNNPKEDEKTMFHPKVLYPVDETMKIYHMEQFGPVIPISTFKNISKPLQSIINSEYGQQCSIFGKDEKLIGRMIDVLVNQVSRVNLNSQCQRGPDSFPFTGRKDSAVGTLSISDAFKVFSIRTLVSAKITEENKKLYKEIIEKNSSEFMKREILF